MLEGINLRAPRLSNPSQVREFAKAKSLMNEADSLVDSFRALDQSSLDGRDGAGVDIGPGGNVPGYQNSVIDGTVRQGQESGEVTTAVVSKKDADGDQMHFTYVAKGAQGETEGDRYVISTKDDDGRHRYEIVKDRASDTLVMFLDYDNISG